MLLVQGGAHPTACVLQSSLVILAAMVLFRCLARANMVGPVLWGMSSPQCQHQHMQHTPWCSPSTLRVCASPATVVSEPRSVSAAIVKPRMANTAHTSNILQRRDCRHGVGSVFPTPMCVVMCVCPRTWSCGMAPCVFNKPHTSYPTPNTKYAFG